MSENLIAEGKLKCGIIMPISQWGNYSAEFWAKVRSFVCEAITNAGMTPLPVWEDDKNDIIHAKIIKNIDTLPVVIGVIVGHNPNVMLECGMRLWKNLPILLLHGDGEKIPFDVGSISCLSFPTNFDYFQVQKLKEDIVQKLRLMIAPGYKSFKSYYSLPAEVEEIKGDEKIDFKQFVDEIRSTLDLVKVELRECKRMIDDQVSGSVVSVRQPFGGAFGSSLSAGMSSCYQTGATGSCGPSGGYEDFYPNGKIQVGTTRWDDSSSDSSSSSCDGTNDEM